MKTRIAVSAGLLILALASDALVGRELWRDYQFSEKRIASETQDAAQAVAHGVDLLFNRVSESLAAVADVLRIHPRSFLPGDPALKGILERHVRDAPMLRNLFVIGIDGTVLAVATYDRSAHAIARELSGLDAFAALWRAGAPGGTGVLMDIDLPVEPPTVPVVLPVVGPAGAVIAVVVADLAPTTIDDGVSLGTVAAGSAISLATRTGRIVACTEAGWGGCDGGAASLPVTALTATATTDAGLVATVRTSTEEQTERWMRFATGVGGAAAALTLGLPVLGWLFVGEIQRRVRARQYLVAENERLAHDYEAVAAELDHREARMRVLIDRIHDAVLVVDRDGVIEDANVAASNLLSTDGASLVGVALEACVPGLGVPDEIDDAHDAVVDEIILERGGAPAAVLEVTFSRDCDLNLPHVLVIIRDVTDQKNTEERLRHMATVDGLTGVLNRRAFMDAAGRALAPNGTTPFTIAMIDADHFKSINDNHGHQTGDEVLRILAGVIRGSVRSDDLVGRFGGEEFIVAMPGMTEMGAMRFADRLLGETRRASVVADDAAVGFTISIGWTVKPAGEKATLDTLIGAADEHLYQAKTQGRDRAIGSRYSNRGNTRPETLHAT